MARIPVADERRIIMTNEEFIKRVMHYASDEYLQSLQEQARKDCDITRPEDFANAVAIGMIKFLISEFM